MDDEVVSTFGNDSASGVRILTTLESSRRKRTSPIKIEGLPVKKKVWQMRALIGLMSMGVISLLTGFVMVLMDGRSLDGEGPSTQANPQSATPTQDAAKLATAATAAQPPGENPLAALIAPPQHAAIAPPPAQAAVIENIIATPALPDAAVTPATAVRPIQTESHPVSTPQARPAATQVAMATPHPDPGKAAIKAVMANAPAAAPAPLATAALTPTPAPAPAKRNTSNGRQDDDVALLEAMFTHTRARPAVTAAPAAGPAVSVADELKRCAALAGATAATCRARVCVQNPTAAACHQDP